MCSQFISLHMNLQLSSSSIIFYLPLKYTFHILELALFRWFFISDFLTPFWYRFWTGRIAFDLEVCIRFIIYIYIGYNNPIMFCSLFTYGWWIHYISILHTPQTFVDWLEEGFINDDLEHFDKHSISRITLHQDMSWFIELMTLLHLLNPHCSRQNNWGCSIVEHYEKLCGQKSVVDQSIHCQ